MVFKAWKVDLADNCMYIYVCIPRSVRKPGRLWHDSRNLLTSAHGVRVCRCSGRPRKDLQRSRHQPLIVSWQARWARDLTCTPQNMIMFYIFLNVRNGLLHPLGAWMTRGLLRTDQCIPGVREFPLPAQIPYFLLRTPWSSLRIVIGVLKETGIATSVSLLKIKNPGNNENQV